MFDIASSLRVVEEAARELGVTPSRVRNLVREDQTRPPEKRRLPSVRKAWPGEELALRNTRRINAIPFTGILVIDVSDIEALQGRDRRGGRPRKTSPLLKEGEHDD